MARNGKKSGGRDFKPGQSGNPNGAPKLPEHIRAIKKLTTKKFIELANRYVEMPVAELEMLADDYSLSAIDVAMARFMFQCAKTGNYFALNTLLDRIIGKVTDNLKIEMPKPTVVEYIDRPGGIIMGQVKEEEEE